MDGDRGEIEFFRNEKDKRLSSEIRAMFNTDPEGAHGRADEILCSLLESEYPLTIAAFRQLEKWYA